MEHQELQPLAILPPPSPFFDEVGCDDDDDDECKVESDPEADDSESEDAEEQEAFPQDEETLHLLDLADDLLGSLEEKVLSDSECVESDAEDEDETCAGEERPCADAGAGGDQQEPLQQQQQRQEATAHDLGLVAGRLDAAGCPSSGGICRRTRAHVSLRDVDLAELEQQLPAHIDIEEIELAEDDEEYGKFLQALFDDTAALPEDSSDEDPDFAADLDLECSKDDDDERDWLRLLNSPGREDSGSATGLDYSARRTRARSKRTKGADALPETSNSDGAGGCPEMTREQLSMLHAQVHCHTQLLVQTFAMYTGDPDSEAQDVAAKAKAMLEQLALARDAQAAARKAMGLPSYTPDDLLRPALQSAAPTPSAPQSAGGGAYGDRAPSGSTDGRATGAATTTATSDGPGVTRGHSGPLAGQEQQHRRLPLGAVVDAVPVAGGAAVNTVTYTEASQDDTPAGGYDWDNDGTGGTSGGGVLAIKAAAAARSAALGAAIQAFRPTWAPGPNGEMWSVLDVVPLRKFPEMQLVLDGLPSMQHSAMKLQRELQSVARTKRKNRRRRGDDPLLGALDWARPALQCLQGHLVAELVYNPSPPVPQSYWTNAEDDLMMYGLTRHGSNWKLISETLLITRSSTQIANRYKNVNARSKPGDHTSAAPDEGRTDTQPLRGVPGSVAAAGPRKPKTGPPATGMWPLVPGPVAGVGVGLTGLPPTFAAAALPALPGVPVTGPGVATTATAVAAASLLNPAAAATAAALAPPMTPDLAAMVNAARLVGLPPAVAAAHILHAKQQQQQIQLRKQQQQMPPPQPPPKPAVPQVPMSVAVQLVAQLQKSGGVTGPAAAAARLIASQLQDPVTAPAAVAALQLAAQQLDEQPSGTAGVANAQNSEGLLARAAQLLQAGVSTAQAVTAALQLPVRPQVAAPLPAIPLTLPLATLPAAHSLLGQLQQQVAALLPFSQTAGPGTSNAGQGPLPAAVAAAATTAAAAAAGGAPMPQPWAAGAPLSAIEGAHGNLPDVAGPGTQNVTLTGTTAHPGGLQPYSYPHVAPQPVDQQPSSWPEQHNSEDEMQWVPSPPSPGVPPTDAFLHGSFGGAAEDPALAAAGPLATQPVGSNMMQAAAPAGLQHGQYGGELLVNPQQPNVALHAVSAMAGAAGSPTAVAADPGIGTRACVGGPTDPRLPHILRDYAGEHLQQHAHQYPQPVEGPADGQVVQQQPGEVSPDGHLARHHPHHHHNHPDPAQHQNHQQHQELPTLSDNFTLGGISELLSHGGLKSGAATPATCFSPQGGVASVCPWSHGRTISVLLGSSLGLSGLLRSDADGTSDTCTPTKRVAAESPQVAGDCAPWSHGRQQHRDSGGVREVHVKTTAHVEAHSPGVARRFDTGFGTPGANPLTIVHRQDDIMAVQQPHHGELAWVVAQLFSPTTPSAGGHGLCQRTKTAGAGPAPQPNRVAALRGGPDVTPSSDPKAKRRSRVTAAATAQDTAQMTTLDLAPSPLEGTAQNDQRGAACGAGDGAAAAGSYHPRPPVTGVEGGAGAGGGGVEGQRIEGPAEVAAGQEGDDEVAGEGLARARKRLRLDAEDDVAGAAAVGLRGKRVGEGAVGCLADEAAVPMPVSGAGAVAPAGMRGHCSAANSAAGSPIKLVGSRNSSGAAAADVAAAAAVALVTKQLEQAVKALQGQTSPPLDSQQPQHSTGTGSSGGSKRRSGSAATTPGASTKRAAVTQFQGGDRMATAEGGAAVSALDNLATAVTAAAAAPQACGAKESGQHLDGAQQPGRLTGQKRGRTGAAQKALGADNDRSATGAMAVPATEPLPGVDANAPGPAGGGGAAGVTLNGCGTVAGISASLAKAADPQHHTAGAPVFAGAVPPSARGCCAGDSTAAEPGAAAPAGAAAKPPRAPPRRTGASAQRLTRASAGSNGNRAARAPPPPSTRQRQPAPATGGASTAAGNATSAAAAVRDGAALPASAAPGAGPSPVAVPRTGSRPQQPPTPSFPSPVAAGASELSCGGLSFHSLLGDLDTLDIVSLAPAISTRSLAALGNPCSPTSRVAAGYATPTAAARADAGPSDAAAAGLAAQAAPGPAGTAAHPTPQRPAANAANEGGQLPVFTSPPHSQLLQLTPFAPSMGTLGSLDILPLFSNSMDQWQALIVGSACGTTSRGPPAPLVAGSTAAADDDAAADRPAAAGAADGVGAGTASVFTNPWSRFMAICSPSSQSHAAQPPPPPAGGDDFSLSAFHSHLFFARAGPSETAEGHTAAILPTSPAAAAAVVTALPGNEVQPSNSPERRPGQGGADSGHGDAASGRRDLGASRRVRDSAAPGAAARLARGAVAAAPAEGGEGGPLPQAEMVDLPPAFSVAAVSVPAEVAVLRSEGPCLPGAAGRPSGAPGGGLEPGPLPVGAHGATAAAARPDMEPIAGRAGPVMAADRPAGVTAPGPRPSEPPAPGQLRMLQERQAEVDCGGTVAAAGAAAAAARHCKPPAGACAATPGGALPPLPPPFSRHGPAPSPGLQQPHELPKRATETVRLFGRTMTKPLPTTSPTMPAPPQLLRCAVLSATVRPFQLSGQDGPGAAPGPLPPADGATAAPFQDHSNSRSRSQPEAAQDPQQLDSADPQPVQLPPMQTPAHGSFSCGSLLRRALSSHDLMDASPGPAFHTTPLVAAAVGAAAPTPIQPLRAEGVAAAGPVPAPGADPTALAQHTPAAARAGAFAVPDMHGTVAVAAPLSLTPLPTLDVAATVAKTVRPRGSPIPRRLHAQVRALGSTISHWASNEQDNTGAHDAAAPGSELLERQGSGGGGWRTGGAGYWHRAARAAGGAAGAGGVASDTPGYGTCVSKVVRRDPAAAVEPLPFTSPSVVQPTPRMRLDRGDEADDGKASQPRPTRPSVGGSLYGNGDHGDDGGDDGEGRVEMADDDVGMMIDGDALDEDGGGEGEEEDDEDEEQREGDAGMANEGRAASEGVAPAAAPPAGNASAVGRGTGPPLQPVVGTADADAPGRHVGAIAADLGATEQPGGPCSAADGAAATGPVTAMEAVSWTKEQDQLVMRELFRLGEGPSTWQSISQQLGGGVWTVESVERRGKELMARMFALM